MKVLVTGATGFIGSHIAKQLVDSGQHVRALIRSESGTRVLAGLGVELCRGDLRDAASLRAALSGVEVVHHCAALVGDWGRWRDFHEIDILGTERMLEAARAAGVRRFVHMSSASVYGLRRIRGRRVTESLSRAPHLWRWDYYGRAKRGAECVVDRHAASGEIEAAMIRPTMVYGPRDRSILPRLVELLKEGRLPIIGSGENWLHLVFVEDVARAAVRAGSASSAGLAVYNLDGRKEITQRAFFESVARLAQVPGPRSRIPLIPAYGLGFLHELVGHATGRSSMPRLTRYLVALAWGEADFDTSRAREELGWEPRIPMHEGLARTAAWYRSAGGACAG